MISGLILFLKIKAKGSEQIAGSLLSNRQCYFVLEVMFTSLNVWIDFKLFG